MVKIILAISLLGLSACHSRELNINALDLSRYSRNLSTSQEHFPAYIALMTPAEGRSGVVPKEVEQITKFFVDKSQPKQLFLVGQPGIEVDARVYAMAKHDVSSRVVEILLEVLDKDAKAQSWTENEYRSVLSEVLTNNNTPQAIFWAKRLEPIFEEYNTVISAPYHKDTPVVDKLSKTKRLVALDEIPRTELTVYTKSVVLDEESASTLALLVHSFIPAISVLELLPLVGDYEGSLELAHQEFIRHNALSIADGLANIKDNMQALMEITDSEKQSKLTILTRKMHQNRQQFKEDQNLEQMKNISNTFKQKHELNRKKYCLDVLKYANANGLPTTMNYLLDGCE